jgi:predicted Zn-dependent protease with MMP-like domain
MNRGERDRFDGLLEGVLASLPSAIHELLEEAPLIVDDRPSPDMLRDLGMEHDEDDVLCGLHSGVALPDRSVEHPPIGDTIHIFRRGIVEHAGGWQPWIDDEGRHWGGEDRIAQEIRITILHEIGHHFGLDEDDLERLGYG